MFRAVDMFILPADDILCLRHGVDYLLGIVDQCADDLFNIAACCIGLLRQILDLGCNNRKAFACFSGSCRLNARI